MWVYYYSKQIQLQRMEALHMPLSELLDLIACHRIKQERRKMKMSFDPDIDIPDLE